MTRRIFADPHDDTRSSIKEWGILGGYDEAEHQLVLFWSDRGRVRHEVYFLDNMFDSLQREVVLRP